MEALPNPNSRIDLIGGTPHPHTVFLKNPEETRYLKYKIERLRIMLDGLELVTEVFMLSGGHCDAKFAA